MQAAEIIRVERTNQDPADRPKLFVTVQLRLDPKVREGGYQDTPTWNGWYVLENWGSFSDNILRANLMSEDKIAELKRRIEEA